MSLFLTKLLLELNFQKKGSLVYIYIYIYIYISQYDGSQIYQKACLCRVLEFLSKLNIREMLIIDSKIIHLVGTQHFAKN